MKQLLDVNKSYNAKATIITAYIAKDNKNNSLFITYTRGSLQPKNKLLFTRKT